MEFRSEKSQVLSSDSTSSFQDADKYKEEESHSDTGSTADVEDDSNLEGRFVKKKYRKRRKKVYFRSDFQENESESSSEESSCDGSLKQKTNEVKEVNPVCLFLFALLFFCSIFFFNLLASDCPSYVCSVPLLMDSSGL